MEILQLKKSASPGPAVRQPIERGLISADGDLIEQIASALYSPRLPHRFESAEAVLESLRNSGLDVVRTALPTKMHPTARRAIFAGSFQDLILNPKNLHATCNREQLSLTLLQFRVLGYLIARSGQAGIVIEPREIIAAVWKTRAGSENRLKTQLSTIRGELRRVRSRVTIDSVRGIGYRLGTKSDTVGRRAAP